MIGLDGTYRRVIMSCREGHIQVVSEAFWGSTIRNGASIAAMGVIADLLNVWGWLKIQ